LEGGGGVSELKKVKKKQKYFQHVYLGRKGRGEKIKSLLFTGHKTEDCSAAVKPLSVLRHVLSLAEELHLVMQLWADALK
jgi:hypothetical protein